MAFTDTLKAALEKKKQANQHPDARNPEEQRVRGSGAPVVANKPQKKVTGRGR